MKYPTIYELPATLLDTCEVQFFLKQDFSVPNFDLKQLEIALEMESGYDLEMEQVAVDLLIRYEHWSEQDPQLVLEYCTRTEFTLNNLETFLHEGLVRADVLYSLVDSAFHMTRGMLSLRTQGTAYRPHLPPLVNPWNLLLPYLGKMGVLDDIVPKGSTE